jgi:lipoate-protein ligase A
MDTILKQVVIDGLTLINEHRAKIAAGYTETWTRETRDTDFKSILSALSGMGFSGVDDLFSTAKENELDLIPYVDDGSKNLIKSLRLVKIDGTCLDPLFYTLHKQGLILDTLYLSKPPLGISCIPEDEKKIDLDYCKKNGIKVWRKRAYCPNSTYFSGDTLFILLITKEEFPAKYLQQVFYTAIQSIVPAATKPSNDIKIGNEKVFGCTHQVWDGVNVITGMVDVSFTSTDKTKLSTALTDASLKADISAVGGIGITEKAFITALKSAFKSVAGIEIVSFETTLTKAEQDILNTREYLA